MAVVIDGTTGITTPDIDTDGLSVDTNAIFVDPATNNVGIGTSTLLGRLNSISAGAALGGTAQFAIGSGTNNFENTYFRIDDSGNSNFCIDQIVGGTSFNRLFIERTTGNVGIGTASALANVAKVQISGGSGSTITSETTGTGATDHVNFRNANGKVGTITTSASSTSYNTSSDYRLKENVAPMQNALVTVAQLNPVTYTWKAGGSAGQGFIAHELQAVVPDCVTGEKDAVRIVDVHDEEGRVIGTKEEPQYQGVDTSFLVGILTAAIQEQQTLIQALTARIEALEQA